MKKRILQYLLVAMAGMAVAVAGAGTAFAVHPNIPLKTYEELAYQFGMKDMATGAGAMPVMIQYNAAGQPTGFPYSPKATCGDCHNGTASKISDGQPILKADGTPSGPLVSYMDMSSQAFHSELGSEQWIDDTTATAPQPGKPWSQTTAMWGKW